MTIKSVVPYFGGKRTLAPSIVEQLGTHRYYFEPFCGSLAVLFAKPKSSHEVVCDLHGDVVNLSKVVRSPTQVFAFYEKLQRTLMSEGIFAESKARLRAAQPDVRDDGNPRRAYDFFVASWMGMNGLSGSNRALVDVQMATRWTPNGGASAVRFRSVVESIPWWHERLRNVQILHRDAFDVLPRISDEAGVVLYADPPYPPETLTGDSRYEHDFKAFDAGADGLNADRLFDNETDDHERLWLELDRFRLARVVVSCYDCERYRRLYSGWTFLDRTRQKNLHDQGGRGKRRATAPEVLIVNGEAL